MESTLGLAFIFLLVLFAVVIYLIRETVPVKRTLGVNPEQKQGDFVTWESPFHSITPNFVLTPGVLQSIRTSAATPILDASGNKF